jgi:hypothetical protein
MAPMKLKRLVSLRNGLQPRKLNFDDVPFQSAMAPNQPERFLSDHTLASLPVGVYYRDDLARMKYSIADGDENAHDIVVDQIYTWE